MKSSIRAGQGLTVRAIRIETGGGEEYAAEFDPGFVALNGKEGEAVAAALCAILQGAAPNAKKEDVRIRAELERNGERFRLSAARDPQAGAFRLMMNGDSPCDPRSFFPCEEERALAFFPPRKREAFAERFRRYRDPERFSFVRELEKRTYGICRTHFFRLYLKEYLDRFLPRSFPGQTDLVLCPDGRFLPEKKAKRLTGPEKEEFDLRCFVFLNRFWQEVEAVRDLHHAPLPLVIFASAAAFAACRKELQSLGRQIFFLSS